MWGGNDMLLSPHSFLVLHPLNMKPSPCRLDAIRSSIKRGVLPLLLSRQRGRTVTRTIYQSSCLIRHFASVRCNSCGPGHETSREDACSAVERDIRSTCFSRSRGSRKRLTWCVGRPFGILLWTPLARLWTRQKIRCVIKSITHRRRALV